MIVLLGLSIAANVGVVVLFVAYATGRDHREAKERAELYQRLQAPEVAVAMAAPPGRIEGLSHVPLDDDDAWQANQIELRHANGSE